MRFRMPLRNAVLLASTTYIVYLGVQQQLNLYIHPRYLVFTFVMSIIGLVLVSLDSYYAYNKKRNHTDDHGSKILYIPLAVLIGAALFLPARTLTSSTISQRLTDSGSLVATAETQQTSTFFAGSSRGLRLIDWTSLISTTTDPAFYANKPANISGFLYDAGLGQDTVWLARFTLTCCAVDAQPIGVPVQIINWADDYNEDDWIEVEGEFSLAQTATGEQLVLIPTSKKIIEQPANPYAN